MQDKVNPTQNQVTHAVLYARVSSKEQQEGFSIAAQEQLLKEYCNKHRIKLAKYFIDIETAKTSGREQFGEMLAYLSNQPHIKAIITEKIDRLYRNFVDSTTVDAYINRGLAIHFVKEACILTKDSPSSQKFIHDIRVVLAKNFIDNLSEETKKGLNQKAETGIYPGLAPFGYLNSPAPDNPHKRIIIIDPRNAPVVAKLFELYATGRYSLAEIRDEAHKQGLRSRTGKMLGKSRMERMIKDIFYYGFFTWGGKQYKGTHTPIISKELFDQVQMVLKDKKGYGFQKRHLAYMGILKCAACGCAITAEAKKNRYVYYRCTNYHGNCPNSKDYYREEIIEQKFSELIQRCYIDEERLSLIRDTLKNSRADEKAYVDGQLSLLNARYTLLRNRLDALYADKLDGKITEQFYHEKRLGWSTELEEIENRITTLRKAECNYYDVGLKFLELSQKLCRYWELQQDKRQRGELVKALLSNCTIKDGTLYPTYRKPFDLIIEGLHSESWGG